MNETPFHIHVIREALSKRQRTNPAYSLRAYGRDLGLNVSTLSQVLNGKRPLPVRNFEQVAQALRLAPQEKMYFVESALRKRSLLDQLPSSEKETRFLIDESNYRILAEWEHYAVLTLCDLTEFTVDIPSISKKLGLSRVRTEAVVQNLILAGLLRRAEDDTFEKVHESVRTTEDISSQALRASHLETFDLGKKKLEAVAVDLRDFSSMNVAIDPDQLMEFKAILREFRKKVLALAKTGKNKRDVYQLALQFYPLTQSNFEEK